MSIISGYEYDIFISYAHVDNVAFPGQAYAATPTPLKKNQN
jgi:hypothetical protein